jgi:hypothetical protein
MHGRSVDELTRKFGPPDKITSAANYGALFQNGQADVVYIYSRAERNVFIDAKGRILGVAPPKSSPPR